MPTSTAAQEYTPRTGDVVRLGNGRTDWEVKFISPTKVELMSPSIQMRHLSRADAAERLALVSHRFA